MDSQIRIKDSSNKETYQLIDDMETGDILSKEEVEEILHQLEEIENKIQGRYFALIEMNFSKRERQIMKYISHYGFNNKQLSEIMGVSKSTINNHLSNMMRKRNVHSSRELVAEYIRLLLYKLEYQEKMLYKN